MMGLNFKIGNRFVGENYKCFIVAEISANHNGSLNKAINLIRLYDGGYPNDQIKLYLDYYEMNKEEFDSVIDRWVNKELFEKKDDLWYPKFNVE